MSGFIRGAGGIFGSGVTAGWANFVGVRQSIFNKKRSKPRSSELEPSIGWLDTP